VGRWRRCWSVREFRVYRLTARDIVSSDAGQELRRDALDELRLYRPYSRSDITAPEFLERARDRLEHGQHVYTLSADGLLLHYSWLVDRAERGGSDFGHEFRFPGPAAVLWDDYTHPSARGRGLQTGSIHRRLRDAASAGAGQIFVGVLADNRVSRHNIEKVGFRHWASGWARYRLGRVRRRWITY
jgi:GNAT superfamily N-acetyltransferase